MLLLFLTFCFLAGQVTWASPTQSQHACDKWTEMATQMTGSGKHQTCHTASSNPPNCTRLDCSGAVRFSVHTFLPIEFDYCFGMQLNSCTRPVSMDFHLQLPKFNFAHAFRISEDSSIDLSSVKVPIGSLGQASPQLDFVFERQANGNIFLSVICKVEIHTLTGAHFFLEDLQRTLVDRETIHALPCEATVSSGSKPPKDFMPECHPGKYQTHSTRMFSTVPPASLTLNKSCDTGHHHCSSGELCDNSRCVCSPDLHPSQDGASCVGQSRRGQNCTGHDDCGINELCLLTKTCQCDHGNEFDPVRHMCVRPPPGHVHHVTTKKPEVKTPKPPAHSNHSDDHSKSKDTATKSSPAGHNQSKSSKSKMPLIVGGAVGGCVVLIAIIIANIYLFRRYRNRQRDGDDRLISESNAALLGSDDDDSNMIM